MSYELCVVHNLCVVHPENTFKKASKECLRLTTSHNREKLRMMSRTCNLNFPPNRKEWEKKERSNHKMLHKKFCLTTCELLGFSSSLHHTFSFGTSSQHVVADIVFILNSPSLSLTFCVTTLWQLVYCIIDQFLIQSEQQTLANTMQPIRAAFSINSINRFTRRMWSRTWNGTCSLQRIATRGKLDVLRMRNTIFWINFYFLKSEF